MVDFTLSRKLALTLWPVSRGVEMSQGHAYRGSSCEMLAPALRRIISGEGEILTHFEKILYYFLETELEF